MNTMTKTFTSDQLCALDELTVLHICGADARSFMQSQLTSPVEDLTIDSAILAGFCQAKGRLQANMMVWSDPAEAQNLYVFLHQSIAETVRKRLSMFLFRSKAELVISQAKVYGVFNTPTPAFTLPTTYYAVTQTEQGTLISAPNASLDQAARAWLISYSNENIDAERSNQEWQAADIAAGLAWIQEKSYEAFLPQDINLDIIGGVSFKKGCFPGQEVVARLHYRSTAKRRAALGTISSDQALDIAIGSDIFDSAAPDRPFGRVINSAYDAKEQKQKLLMEVRIDDLEQKELHAESTPNLPIQLVSLPYAWEIAKY